MEVSLKCCLHIWLLNVEFYSELVGLCSAKEHKNTISAAASCWLNQAIEMNSAAHIPGIMFSLYSRSAVFVLFF